MLFENEVDSACFSTYYIQKYVNKCSLEISIPGVGRLLTFCSEIAILVSSVERLKLGSLVDI